MQKTMKGWPLAASLAALAPMLAVFGACSKDPAASTSTATPASSSTATVAAPPGDSTPKPADSMAAPAMPQNEKTTSANPSTVGTASSGAPPYSLQGAPEGNPATSQGSKPADPKK